MATLDYERLHGIWAGLPVAWNESLDLDEDAYAADVEACCRAGAHGVYTGGTTGEFYAQDEQTFRRIVALTVSAARATDTPVQAGCTATSTRLVCRRIEIAAELGAHGIQIALPFWLAVSDAEALSFVKDVAAAAGNLPLILYKTDRSKRHIDANLARRLRDAAPTLIGCKFTGPQDDLREFIEALPELSVFVGEPSLPDAARVGARGSYSSLFYLRPDYMLRYYHLCEQRRFDEVAPMQSELKRLCDEGIRHLREKGMMDSGIDRVFATALGFLRCGLRCQPPYVHATRDDVETLKAWMRNHAPLLMEGR
ncbi:MAG: dihydrodipicolinate synthase family protein [Phycisphaerae bacterium]|nr:dihydrodipicolinate synthase family protein [Phycisphaerae bacterium]